MVTGLARLRLEPFQPTASIHFDKGLTLGPVQIEMRFDVADHGMCERLIPQPKFSKRREG